MSRKRTNYGPLTPPSSPKQRRMNRSNERMEDDGDGNDQGGEGGEGRENMVIPWQPTTYKMTIQIRTRGYINVDFLESNTEALILPWQLLDWNIMVPRNGGSAANYIHPKARLITGTMENTGFTYWRPLSMGFRLSHFIPLSEELETQGGTVIETTTFNSAPYILVGVDTAGRFQQLVCRTLDGNNSNRSTLLKGVIANLGVPNNLGDHENGLISNFAQIDTLTQQSSLTYNHHFNIPKPWAYMTEYKRTQLHSDDELTYNYRS